jgi:hypothetical protein
MIRNTLSAIAAITGGLLLAGSAVAFATTGTRTLDSIEYPVAGENGATENTPEPIDTTSPATLEDWVEPTAAQIAAHEEAMGESVAIWVEQQRIIVACMADQGLPYTWDLSTQRTESSFDFNAYVLSLPQSEQDTIRVALHGDWDGEYLWSKAGCHGLAVHETGQGDAN